MSSDGIIEDLARVLRGAVAVALGLAVLALAASASADEQGYGFVLADQPTTDRYFASGPRAHNDTAGRIEIRRGGVGSYIVHFDRFEHLSPGGGHVQVTAVGSVARDCKVTGWVGVDVGVRCFDASGAPADSVFSLLHLRPSIYADHVAFAWANDPTAAVYAPSESYGHNPFDPIKIQRQGTGRYRVEFRRHSEEGPTFGHPQVTAYGNDSHRCQVQRWSSDFVYVDCYDVSGAPVDTRFTVLLLEPSSTDQSMAFAWADQPVTVGYAPDSRYAHNPTGAPILATRLGVGHYEMVFDGLDSPPLDVSNVQVSAYGVAPALCQLETWDADSASVRCFDAAGAPVDTFYNVFFQKVLKTDWTPDYAFASAWDESNPSYSLTDQIDTWNPTGGEIRATRSSEGRYRVEFEGFETIPGGGNAQVSAVSGDGSYCNPERWHSRFVYVECFDRFGSYSDTDFNVFWLKAQPGDGTVGYAWGEYPFAGSYVPNAAWSHSPTSQLIFIDRLDVGDYEVTWTDAFTPPGPPRPSHYQVSAYDSNAICGLATERITPANGSMTVGVQCHAADGAAVDPKFSVLLLMPERHHRSIGFATAEEGSLAIGSDFNSGDRPVLGSDWGEGLGLLDFLELPETGLGTGTLQVTPVVDLAANCAVVDWAGEEAWARCLDEQGDPALPSFQAMLIYRTAAPEPGFGLGLFAALGLLAGMAVQSRRSRRSR
jgi:hypothetical protein